MELIKEEKAETKYTIEFTETELMTLIAHFGGCSYPDAKAVAKLRGFKLLNNHDNQVVYDKMCKIFER